MSTIRTRRFESSVERELRAARPEPPDALVDAVLARTARTSVRSVSRLAVAAAVSTTMVAALAAVGAPGYAANAAKSAAAAVAKAASPPGQEKKDDPPAAPAAQPAAPAPEPAAPASQPVTPASPPVTTQQASKTTICHATGSSSNPFVEIEVADSALPAHQGHGDIIPAPAGGCPGPSPGGDQYRPGKGCGDPNHVHFKEGQCTGNKQP